jgi:ABC-2 type transport system ATP-binding protein
LGAPAQLIASLGIDHLVEFSAADQAQRFDLEPLRQIPGVREARADNGAVTIQASELHRVLPAILERLRQQGIPIGELRTHSATLEDVFVSLTGRHLRDE